MQCSLFLCEYEHMSISLLVPTNSVSVHLNIDVDVADEFKGSKEGDSAEHEKEHVTGEHCVAKELYCLQHAGHVRTFKVVEEGVQEHEETCRPVKTIIMSL